MPRGRVPRAGQRPGGSSAWAAAQRAINNSNKKARQAAEAQRIAAAQAAQSAPQAPKVSSVEELKAAAQKNGTAPGALGAALNSYVAKSGGGCGCSGNVQAKKDLDNLTMLYGGEKVPQGAEIVGGAKCGDDGVGTSHPKSETFKQYLENMNNTLDLAKGGSRNVQKGAGFSVEPGEFVAGRAVVKSYDDCCPPALVGGKLQFGAPDQPVCGLGAVRGGGRRKHLSTKKHSGKSHKKSRKSRKHHSKRHSKKHTKRRTHRKTQRGGDFTGLQSSKPADYATAFDGPKSVLNYPENMMERTFDETQPMWSPKAI